MKQFTFFSSSLFIFLCGTYTIFLPNENEIASAEKDYPTSLVSLNDFQNLATEIENHRAERLINLDSFIEMSRDENTIILDTRSKLRYDRKHLAGAIHLAFTEFSQANLEKVIPNSNTKILIYCNNNFLGDQVDFVSKVSSPPPMKIAIEDLPYDKKPVMLALNIPTYLNLYGYGYKNIYELDELVNVNDLRVKFEGSTIEDFPKEDAIQINKVPNQKLYNTPKKKIK